MSDTVIKVENLSKLYQLGEVGTGTISHDLNRFFAKVRGKEDPFAKVGQLNDRTQQINKSTNQRFNLFATANEEHVWALKDINFEVKQGEVLGIIGKNGAGKSTLLKLLSRVTAPTTGSIKVKGRVASLLEVGTGFHPEMTGRENIFMNGTILGMTRREIQSKLDEIVDFAGIAKYLDTPTKRYSSGMSVRLAFAVAAFLEPEILIVDEVLAVGDAEFQKRAIGKMQDISKGEGRTVLFVSHNMNSIKNLCNRGILLNKGQVVDTGTISAVVSGYLKGEINQLTNNPVLLKEDVNKKFQLIYAALLDSNFNLKNKFECDEDIFVSIHCQSREKIPGLYGYLTITNNEGLIIIENDTFDFTNDFSENLNQGLNKFKLILPKRILSEGSYLIYINFSSKLNNTFNVDSPKDILRFDVEDTFTKRGASRRSLLSTIIKWEKVDVE